jgi:hypothetical protein
MSKKNKALYSFKIQDGSREREFGLIKPNRKLKQEGEIYYTAQLSRLVSAGVLPRAIWEKVIKNNGGAISDPEKKEYSDLYKELIDLNKNLLDVSSKTEEDISEEEKQKETSQIQAKMMDVRRKMQALESEQMSLYDNTAEVKARNSTIIWWSMYLAGEKNESGEFVPVIKGEDVDEKLDQYDIILEENPFLSGVIKRLNYLTTVWYIGVASSEEEFKSFDEDYLKDIKINSDKIDLVEGEEGAVAAPGGSENEDSTNDVPELVVEVQDPVS